MDDFILTHNEYIKANSIFNNLLVEIKNKFNIYGLEYILETRKKQNGLIIYTLTKEEGANVILYKNPLTDEKWQVKLHGEGIILSEYLSQVFESISSDFNNINTLITAHYSSTTTYFEVLNHVYSDLIEAKNKLIDILKNYYTPEDENIVRNTTRVYSNRIYIDHNIIMTIEEGWPYLVVNSLLKLNYAQTVKDLVKQLDDLVIANANILHIPWPNFILSKIKNDLSLNNLSLI